MRRRTFLAASSALTLRPGISLAAAAKTRTGDLLSFDKDRVVKQAGRYLEEKPVTVTATASPRSAGGLHDFYSEADYWWPDPKNPTGPYVQRDGMSNPDNFSAHRRAMVRLSVQVPALAAAWMLTRDRRYADHAALHLRAWFIDAATRMNPHLKFSQAIRGINTGRSIGVIDTLHLVEVARAAAVLEPALSEGDRRGVKGWFSHYLNWMTTHEYGTTERDAKNNHGTCWVLQAAEFARYVGSAPVTDFCRHRYKTVLLPTQLAADGSFPQELRRTKPYGYSLFQLDVLAGVCQTLSTPRDDLWTFTLPDGRNMAKAMEFMVPFIADKKKWTRRPDVMYDAEWPIRHPALVFAGVALNKPDYVALWKTLKAESTVDEVIRNYPIRQPVLWLEGSSRGA